MPPVTILGTAPTKVVDLEDGVLARLRAKVSGVEVESYPDRPDTYRLKHQVGALLVAYRGAQYTMPEAVAEVIQERECSIDVVVVTRSLSGHRGSYHYLEAARLALAGHQVPGFRKLVPRSEQFVGYAEGTWTFAITLSAATVAAELAGDGGEP